MQDASIDEFSSVEDANALTDIQQSLASLQEEIEQEGLGGTRGASFSQEVV